VKKKNSIKILSLFYIKQNPIIKIDYKNACINLHTPIFFPTILKTNDDFIKNGQNE